MAIKFFWLYIGLFLVFAILLVTLVKQFAEAFVGSGKKPIIYGTFSSIVASAAAFGSTFITNYLFWVYWIFVGIFLLFGIIHMALMHKKYFYSPNNENSKVIIGEIFFGLSIIFFVVVVFSSLKYFLGDKSFLFYPMLVSLTGFFIPMIFVHAFEAAYNIPPAVFKTWYYPLNDPINLPDEKPGEKIYVIGFEIAKKPTDSRKTYFRAKAPEGMKLGELYYHFMNDYNELQSETPIEYANDGYEPYEWWFRRKPKWYQGQYILNPDISIRENKIKENTVIICERI